MSEHTPGPWRYHADGDANHYCILAGERWLISFLHNGEQLTPVQESNIHLMVAAPEMLYALELFDALMSRAADPGGVGVSMQRMTRAWDLARAAIAKARGKE